MADDPTAEGVCRGPPLWDMAPAHALVCPGLSLEEKQTSCSQEATWGQVPLHRGGHVTQQCLQGRRGVATPGPRVSLSQTRSPIGSAGLRLRWALPVGDWEQRARLLPPPLTPFCPGGPHTHLGRPEPLTPPVAQTPTCCMHLCCAPGLRRPWVLTRALSTPPPSFFN